MIKPTVGRVVWFTPSSVHPVPDFLSIDPKQPCNASVAYVWNDRMVNLTVSDHYGKSFNMTSVQLLQDDDAAPANGYFCSWMPYQAGQAARVAELAAQAEAARAKVAEIAASAGRIIGGLAETDAIDKPL